MLNGARGDGLEGMACGAAGASGIACEARSASARSPAAAPTCCTLGQAGLHGCPARLVGTAALLTVPASGARWRSRRAWDRIERHPAARSLCDGLPGRSPPTRRLAIQRVVLYRLALKWARSSFISSVMLAMTSSLPVP